MKRSAKAICRRMLAGLVLLAAATLAQAGEQGVAARVNGAEISNFRLERHFEDYLVAQSRSVAAIRNPAVYTRLKREALDQLIDKELLWQEAQSRGIEIEEAQVQRRLAELKGAFPNPEAFARRLAKAGFDEPAYVAYLRRELAASRMLLELGGAVSVSESEVRRLFEETRDRFDPSVDEARGQALIRAWLQEQRRAEARQAALERLRRKADIERLARL